MEAVLSKFKILSCTNNKKNGKTEDSEADRSSTKLRKSHKNGPNSPTLPSNYIDNLSFPSMLPESQISPKPLAKRLILNFFLQSFLSLDVYDRAPRRDVINGCSRLTSQPPSGSGHSALLF